MSKRLNWLLTFSAMSVGLNVMILSRSVLVFYFGDGEFTVGVPTILMILTFALIKSLLVQSFWSHQTEGDGELND